MRTIQELQAIQQQLVAAVKSQNPQNALQIISDTGVTLSTSVCGFTANNYLGQKAVLHSRDDRFRVWCQAHAELNFDYSAYARGVGMSGNRAYAEQLRTHSAADVDWIAHGAAQGGHRVYAEELRTMHGASVNEIARGAAAGGHRDYAEELRTQFGADITVILRAAHGEYLDFLQSIIDQSEAAESESSRPSSPPGLFSDATPQSSSAAREKAESIADYSGLISINIPTNPETLDQFESQLSPHFRCPITLSVFTQPVITADGETYEYKAIRQHLESQLDEGKNPTSPTTNKPLAHLNLVPNNIVSQLINKQLAVLNASQTNGKTSERQGAGKPKKKRARVS